MNNSLELSVLVLSFIEDYHYPTIYATSKYLNSLRKYKKTRILYYDNNLENKRSSRSESSSLWRPIFCVRKVVSIFTMIESDSMLNAVFKILTTVGYRIPSFSYIPREAVYVCYDIDKKAPLAFPHNITTVIFGNFFNHPISYFPNTIKKLRFGMQFNSAIAIYPKYLRKLFFEYKFNQHLDNLNDGLKYLSLGSNFNQSVDKLPTTLRVLRFVENDFITNRDFTYLINLKFLQMGHFARGSLFPTSLIYVKHNGSDFISRQNYYRYDDNDYVCGSKISFGRNFLGDIPYIPDGIKSVVLHRDYDPDFNLEGIESLDLFNIDNQGISIKFPSTLKSIRMPHSFKKHIEFPESIEHIDYSYHNNPNAKFPPKLKTLKCMTCPNDMKLVSLTKLMVLKESKIIEELFKLKHLKITYNNEKVMLFPPISLEILTLKYFNVGNLLPKLYKLKFTTFVFGSIPNVIELDSESGSIPSSVKYYRGFTNQLDKIPNNVTFASLKSSIKRA